MSRGGAPKLESVVVVEYPFVSRLLPANVYLLLVTHPHTPSLKIKNYSTQQKPSAILTCMEQTHLNADGTTNVKKPYPIFVATESLARKALSTLDARQAIFAAKYVETFDAAAAEAESGYNEGYGSVLLKHPQVARAIQLLQTAKLHKIESALPVNAELVINGIVRNIHALEAKGKNEATFKGYELLGKHLSMWTENINVSDTTPVLSEPERASKIAALVALAQKRAEAQEARTIDAEVIPTPTDTELTQPTPIESSLNDTLDEDLI